MEHQGIIKYYNDKKKYGFITVKNPSNRKELIDIFFRSKDIIDPSWALSLINEGDRVRFIMNQNKKKQTAINIRKLK